MRKFIVVLFTVILVINPDKSFAQNTYPDPFDLDKVPYEGLTIVLERGLAGKAMYYNPGVMEKNLRLRQSWGEIYPECHKYSTYCVGYVAFFREGDLGRRLWIESEEGTIHGPFLVVDVSALKHYPMHKEMNWVIDVDTDIAVALGMYRIGPKHVTVLDLDTNPPE